MKTSVISMIGIQNYGSVLQVFATKKKLEEYTDNVEIINNIQNSRLVDIVGNNGRNPFRLLVSIISCFFYAHIFKNMKNKYLNMSTYIYSSKKDFDEYNADADIYCVGSDQLWNTDYCRHMYLAARFLGFIPEGKRKFAFSSSFGKEHVDNTTVAQTKGWIHQFERISVREESGVKILKEQYDYPNAVHLVDPTLAMPPEFWRRYAPKPRIVGQYILVFQLTRNRKAETFAKKLSKKTELPLVHLCSRFSQILLHGKKILFPPYFELISLIDNARYVLTDSFHGAAFSMNLNTEPIIFLYRSNPGRITNLLRLLDAEQRVVSDFNDFDIVNRPVDFEHINNVLAKERERVDEFLRGVFHRESET